MTGWVLRPIVWFATASMATTIFHELTHAIVAYTFGVRSTLHNYFVHLDLTPEQAATNIPAIIGVAGVVGVGAIHFQAGRELTRWVPPTTGRLAGMLGIVVIPVVVGMALVVFANVPAASAAVRAAEASFWIFAGIGALLGGADVGRGADRLRWADIAALLLVSLIVRLLLPGIPFVP